LDAARLKIMATERITNRSALRFAEEVKDCFSFLETLGFRRVLSDATFVRFESPRANLNIYHGRRSFEIGLEIESRSDAYSFSEILRLLDQEQGEQYRNYAAQTAQGVADGVRKLADLLRRSLATGILDDKQLFARLEVQRKKLANNYARETQLEQARRKSEAAWRKKDYMRVVNALKPLRAALTATEAAKLKFAENQVRHSGSQT
jgi:hypothetical protein